MRNGCLKAVVFDFDGTLAEPSIDFPAMKRQLQALARNYAPWAKGAGETPALEWLEALATELHRQNPGAAQSLRDKAQACIRDIEAEAALRARLFPFAREVLAGLSALGLGTAIITRNCSQALYTVFPDVRQAVGVVLTRDDVRRVKPDPEHLAAALDALGAAPEQTLMVGDHPLDVETGRRMGAMTAGVLTGSTGREALLAAGADFVVRDCAGLRGALAMAGLLPVGDVDRGVPAV